MYCKTIPAGPLETNTYLAGDTTTGECWIIDPTFNTLSILSALIEEDNLTPKAIVLTHSHWDHIADAASVQKKWQLPLYVHSKDKGNVETPGSDGLPLLYPIEQARVDHTLVGGETLHLGSLSFSVLHTPGHTPGGICLYCEQEQLLFSGDTLFKGTFGNLSFKGCDAEKMWDSLELLGNLPGTTKVFPGHGEPTTIEDEPWLLHARTQFGGA